MKAGAKETRAYLYELKDLGGKLKAVVESINQSAFKRLVGISTNTDILSVQLTDLHKAAEALGQESSMTILQVATPQINTGATLSAYIPSGVLTTAYRIMVAQGGASYELTLDLNYTDANRTIQQKLADLINQDSRLNIICTMNLSENKGISTLTLEGSATGEQAKFTIQDIEGDLIAKLEADQLTQEAADAVYTLNNMVSSSDKNTIDLGNGLSVTLKQPTVDPVYISVLPDYQKTEEEILKMIDLFNKLRKLAQQNPAGKDQGGVSALQQRLDSTIRIFLDHTLTKIGIVAGQKGFLQADLDSLKSAIKDGTAEEALSGKSMFMRSVYQIAQSVFNDPQQFVG